MHGRLRPPRCWPTAPPPRHPPPPPSSSLYPEAGVQLPSAYREPSSPWPWPWPWLEQVPSPAPDSREAGGSDTRAELSVEKTRCRQAGQVVRGTLSADTHACPPGGSSLRQLRRVRLKLVRGGLPISPRLWSSFLSSALCSM